MYIIAHFGAKCTVFSKMSPPRRRGFGFGAGPEFHPGVAGFFVDHPPMPGTLFFVFRKRIFCFRAPKF